MIDVKIEEVLNRAHCLKNNNQEDRYNTAYFHFLKYFEDKPQLTDHDLIIAANFTYGWMPTILNFKNDNFASAVDILNKAKQEQRINNVELLRLKELINNSLVGVSKLLHFINPHVYAIWDSRVCQFLTGKSHKQKVEKLELFWSYLDFCQQLSKTPEFCDIHLNYQHKIGFNISPLRTAEQIMFISSDKPLR